MTNTLNTLLIAFLLFWILLALLYPVHVRSTMSSLSDKCTNFMYSWLGHTATGAGEGTKKAKPVGETVDEMEEMKESLYEGALLEAKDFISKRPEKSIVMFATSSCPHCTSAFEAYKELAGDLLGKKAFVLTVDSEGSTGITSAFNITHVPTFAYFEGVGDAPEFMQEAGFVHLEKFLFKIKEKVENKDDE